MHEVHTRLLRLESSRRSLSFDSVCDPPGRVGQTLLSGLGMERPDRNVWPTRERMKCICVFCGSNAGARDDYTNGARDLASTLVREKLTLVYGGGRVGLMGIVADEVLRLGGQAIGVIPRPL